MWRKWQNFTFILLQQKQKHVILGSNFKFFFVSLRATNPIRKFYKCNKPHNLGFSFPLTEIVAFPLGKITLLTSNDISTLNKYCNTLRLKFQLKSNIACKSNRKLET